MLHRCRTKLDLQEEHWVSLPEVLRGLLTFFAATGYLVAGRRFLADRETMRGLCRLRLALKTEGPSVFVRKLEKPQRNLAHFVVNNRYPSSKKHWWLLDLGGNGPKMISNFEPRSRRLRHVGN